MEKKVKETHDILTKLYGPVHKTAAWHEDSVMDGLVSTILSQNTNDRNSGRAFASLKKAFPHWEQCREAEEEQIKEAIKHGGLANVKAKRIKGVLNDIYNDYGKTDLEFIKSMSTEEVKKVLGKYKGVGPKTIACVLMFQLQRDDFPVDTHVHRVSNRLGWTPISFDREDTYNHLNQKIPDALKYDMHVLMIRHGRSMCNSQRPKCSECPLSANCHYYKNDEENQGKSGTKKGVNKQSQSAKETSTSGKSRKRDSTVKRTGDIEDLVKTESNIVNMKKEEAATEILLVCGGRINVPSKKSKR